MGTIFSPLGTLKGRIGNVVFRNSNGKTVVCRRPQRKAKPTEQALAWRKKFKNIIAVSSAINKNPFLSKFWPKKGRFNLIVKTNIKFTDPDKENYYPIIIPGVGFPVEDAKTNISDKGIKIIAWTKELDSGIDTSIEKWVAAAGIIIFKEPLRVGDNEIEAIEVSSDPQAIDFEKPVDIGIELTGLDSSLYSSYRKAKAILTLITLTVDGVPVSHSVMVKAEN
jgi:hypothetical protein